MISSYGKDLGLRLMFSMEWGMRYVMDRTLHGEEREGTISLNNNMPPSCLNPGKR